MVLTSDFSTAMDTWVLTRGQVTSDFSIAMDTWVLTRDQLTSDFSLAMEQVVSLRGALSSLDEIGSASSLHSDRIFSNALAQTPYSNNFYIYSN